MRGAADAHSRASRKTIGASSRAASQTLHVSAPRCALTCKMHLQK